jgi:hypothetical protein
VLPQIHRAGIEKTPILVIDDVVDNPDALVGYAASLAPFPPEAGNYYPGLRLQLPNEPIVIDYVTAVCRTLANLMGSAYGIRNFAVQSVAFSIVTKQPSELLPLQAIPHFDSPDPLYFAVLHYLSHHEGSATAFFRHARTGFETMTPQRAGPFRRARDMDMAVYGAPEGYVRGSTNGFEEIGRVEGHYNRLVVYPGNLFHSGILPEDYDFSPDPRRGRLTTNIFLNGEQ